jgi:hypothetical protein
LLDQSTFVEFADHDVASARAALLQALASAPVGVTPDDWQYLKPEQVSRAIESNSANMGVYLDNLIAKFSQDVVPYENPALLELRRMTRHYQVLLENQRNRNEIREAFESSRRELGDALARFERTGSLADHERIALQVHWLERHEQAVDVVRAAREDLSFPNLVFRLPADLLRKVTLQQTPPEAEAINRNSDGIQTVGTMEVRGQWYLEPTPAVGGGLLTMQFQGEVRFSAGNTRRRIQFSNSGLSQVAAVARIAIDDRPYVSAEVLDVGAATGMTNGKATVDQCLFRRPIGLVADRAIARKTPEVEAGLSREVSDGARTKLKTQLDEMTAKANDYVNNVIFSRARRLDLTPRVGVWTTEAGLQLGLTEDVQCGLAAPGPALVPPDDTGSVSLHQSLATDLLNILYVRRKRPREIDVNTLQILNEQLHDSLPNGPLLDAKVRDREDVKLVIELEFPEPFHVAFHAGLFALTLRARELRLVDDVLPAHDLTIEYRVSAGTGGVIQFQKNGDPHVSPRGETREADRKVVDAVRNELLSNLSPAFSVDAGKLLGASLPLPMSLRGLTAERGWLVGSVGHRDDVSSPSPTPQTGE